MPVRFFSFEAFGVSSPFDPTFHYVTSPVFPPIVVGVLRSIFAVYALTTLVVTFIHHSNRGTYLSFFTNLSYTGLTVYICISGAQTIAFVHRKRKSYPLQTWPRFIQLLYVILCSPVIVYPIIVSAVFWGIIAKPDLFNTRHKVWSNISVHGINSFFALFEILFTHGGPSPWTHLVPVVLIVLSYLGVVYLTHATQGFYPYSFLDPSRGGGVVAAYIIGMTAGCCVVFCIVWGLCWLRRWINLRCHKSACRGPRASHQTSTAEWNENAVSIETRLAFTPHHRPDPFVFDHQLADNVTEDSTSVGWVK